MTTDASIASGDPDLQSLQAQLRQERARLANEIEGRLNGASFSKLDKAAVKKNPFALSSSPGLHHQSRPITLGLGAELIKNGESSRSKDTEISAADRRLRGALVGKRKRPEIVDKGAESDDDQDDSRGRVAEGVKSRKNRKDPFALGKARQHQKIDSESRKKTKNDTEVSTTMRSEITERGLGDKTQKSADLSLTKSAKKRLRKKLQKESMNNSGSSAASTTSNPHDVPPDHGKAELPPLQRFGQSKGEANGASSLLPAKLAGARFRQINETLYTSPSSGAVQMVKSDPAKLVEYHEGFREQVKGWPKIPVRQIFDMIVAAQRQSAASKTMPKAKGNGVVNKRTGMHTHGALMIDLGAGEGFLAKWLANEKNIDVRILSYDLLNSDDGWVVGMDIARVGGLPLPGKPLTGKVDGDGDEDRARVVDVAIFCLSLMATNWVDKVREASRVLRPHGELIIAEVTSRFSDLDQFADLVESLGFKRQHTDLSNTHFVLLTFLKLPASQVSLPYTDDKQLARLIERGSLLLKPCIYKRR